MNTDDKGAIAEQRVILRALEKGYIVSKPVYPCRYDMILDDGTNRYRTQVKYSDQRSVRSEGSLVVNLSTMSNRKRLCYEADQIDLVLAYLAPLDKVICLKPALFVGRSSIMIRYKPSTRYRKYKWNLLESLEW